MGDATKSAPVRHAALVEAVCGKNIFAFRRMVLLRAALFFLLVIGFVPLPAQNESSKQKESSLPLSPVIWVEHPGVVQEFTVDPARVARMVDNALLELTSASDIGTAWKRLGITPGDVVGIKISTAGGPAFCTHHSLVKAICAGLEAAGVPPSQIIIWDKFQDKMRTAGYAPRAASGLHPAIASVVPGNSYDPGVYYRNGLIGSLIWGDYQFMQSVGYGGLSGDTAARSYYTTFVTKTCTKLINVPVPSGDPYVGINGCMSSLALGSVDNNRRFQGAPTYGDPAICEILDHDFLRRKVVVHILDALVVQGAGGPGFNPQFCQGLGALYVGRDPVAIDSIVLPRVEQLRQGMNVPPIGKLANYIKSANYYNLGTSDRRRIQLVRLP